MENRKFGNTGIEVSLLGFGMMRLPILNKDSGQIHEKLAMKMVRTAIDQGVNYIDTAYGYHKGNSEIVTAKVLADGYRQKVFLATKMPTWLTFETSDFEKYLQEQKSKLHVDCIDMYLLHALDEERWNRIYNLGVLDFMEKKRKNGDIRFIGFSFHDALPVFKKIIDAYPWDFCQIQLNYMDTHTQAGLEGYEYASSKGIAIIDMEPVKGGKLANPPQKIQKIFETIHPLWSPTEWALRWVGNLPDISLILSGMSTFGQVESNLRTFQSLKANSFSEAEQQAIAQARTIYESSKQILCTRCGYCSPCPEGVAIPEIFETYNEGIMFESMENSIFAYKNFFASESRADRCIECKRCESLCPQNLPIVELLKLAHSTLRSK